MANADGHVRFALPHSSLNCERTVEQAAAAAQEKRNRKNSFLVFMALFLRRQLLKKSWAEQYTEVILMALEKNWMPLALSPYN